MIENSDRCDFLLSASGKLPEREGLSSRPTRKRAY